MGNGGTFFKITRTVSGRYLVTVFDEKIEQKFTKLCFTRIELLETISEEIDKEDEEYDRRLAEAEKSIGSGKRETE